MIEQSGPIKDSGLIDYPFPLRKDMTVHLILPEKLSAVDLKRLTAFMDSLVIATPTTHRG